MQKTIIFPFDDEKTIAEKLVDIESIVGKDNMCTYGVGSGIPTIDVRCTWNQWRKIKFAVGLVKVYY